MNIRRVLCGGLAMAAALWAYAAHAENWYQVEVIAFRYLAENSGAWAAAERLPDVAAATQLADGTDPPDPLAPVAYRRLGAHELRLAGAYAALGRSGDLERLFHVGWHQPAGDTRAVYLPGDPSAPAAGAELPAPPVFAGTLRVGLGREPFTLDANFRLDLPDAQVAIGESRRIRLDELHYLDHPLAGLIVQVTALAGPESPIGEPIPPLPDADALPD
ncbi:MAG: CsiV family protein [Gammaproteobacteria bacterium]